MTSMKDMPYHSGIKFRAYLSTEQQRIANVNLGIARFVYNRLVAWNNELYMMRQASALVPAYRERIEYLSAAVSSSAGMKTAVPFLNGDDVDSQMIADTFMNYQKAWKQFKTVPGTEPPAIHKFRYAGSYQTSPHYPKGADGLNSGNVKLLDRHHVQVPKLGRVKISGSDKRIQWLIDHQANTRFGTVTVSIDSVGRYFISIQLGSEVPFADKLPDTGKAVGIDMNIENFLSDSDGNVVGSPKYRRGIQEKLSKAQKRASRRQTRAKAEGRKLRTSRNYQKARKRVAFLQEKAAARRADFQHGIAKKLVMENDVIVREDLQVKNLLRNHKLAFAIADQAWSAFFQKLEAKACLYGRTCVKVPPHNTSQTCHVCGHTLQKGHRLTLKDREWTCPECGTHHSRDVNAAKVILHRGLELLAAYAA